MEMSGCMSIHFFGLNAVIWAMESGGFYPTSGNREEMLAKKH